jgi:hypothetical protein
MRRPEVELLVVCARPRLDEAQKRRVVELVRQGIDWQFLVRTSSQHSLASLVYSHLNEVCPEAVPADYRSIFRGHFQNNARLNFVRTLTLLDILDATAKAGISAIPFKGPVLAEMAYGNSTHREYADLDLIVDAADVPHVEQLLTARGFEPEFHLSPRQRAAFLQHDCEHPFTRDNGRLVVEVHWRFEPSYVPFALDLNTLRSRLISVSVGGREVRTFCVEDLLLILAMHGAKHCWFRLGWVCDIAGLIAAYPGLDWRMVMDNARSLRIERAVLLCLRLAHDTLGAAVPDDIIERARADRWVTRLSRRAAARFDEGYLRQPGIRDLALFHLMVREHPLDRLRYVWRRLTTTSWEDWSHLQLPDRLFPLYPALRPALFGLKVWKFVRKGWEPIGVRGGALSRSQAGHGSKPSEPSGASFVSD